MRRAGRKRAPRPVTLAERVVSLDRITMERATMLGDALEEREIVDPEDGGRRQALSVSDAPLDRLSKAQHITRSMWEAGDKLRAHWLQSGLDTMRAADWTRPYVDGGQSKPEPELRERHIRQYRLAMAALRPWHANVIRDIVLDERAVEDCSAVRAMYASPRDRLIAGMTELRNALRALAEHFGLPHDWSNGT